MVSYEAIREHDLQIPDDISVMGFDNQEIIVAALRPSLSTMQLPHYAMGQWAVNHLIESADKGNHDNLVQHRLKCPYVPRRSIGRARGV
jgi:LacI family transcriptional regulator